MNYGPISRSDHKPLRWAGAGGGYRRWNGGVRPGGDEIHSYKVLVCSTDSARITTGQHSLVRVTGNIGQISISVCSVYGTAFVAATLRLSLTRECLPGIVDVPGNSLRLRFVENASNDSWCKIKSALVTIQCVLCHMMIS